MPKQAGAQPVGTGPFKFVEWKKNSHVTVARNESYWMKDASGQQLPYLDGITYRLIIDDSVRMLEMKAGTADFTELIQGKDVADAKGDPKLSYLQADWYGNAYRLIFDASGGKFHNNVKLRQAALYADRPRGALEGARGRHRPGREVLPATRVARLRRERCRTTGTTRPRRSS